MSELELWFWRIAGGTGGSVLHNHDDNEQIGIIMRGALDFRISDPDDQRRTMLRAGDVYLANKNIWHGDSNFIGDDELNEVWILDVFAPPRTRKEQRMTAIATGASPSTSAARSPTSCCSTRPPATSSSRRR